MIKTINLKDCKVKVELFDTIVGIEDSFFKYVVHSYDVASDCVEFSILASPRRGEGIDHGWKILTVIDGNRGESRNISTSAMPQVHDSRILFVHGLRHEEDSVRLYCSLREFNLYQIGMLAWNICHSKHTTKLVYEICAQCGSITTRKLPLNACNTFSVDSHCCCDLPDAVVIKLVRDINYSQQSNSRFNLVIPRWFKFRDVLLNSALVEQHVNILKTRVAYTPANTTIMIETVCPSCGIITGDPQPANTYEVANICPTCASRIHTCCNCGTSGLIDQRWGLDEYLCTSCYTISQCIGCTAADPHAPDSITRRTSNGYWLCYEHMQAYHEHGAYILGIVPELPYSWKKSGYELRILDKDKDPMTAIEKVSVIPAVALEWEFPFNSDTCKTTVRDRAIYEFTRVCKEHGYGEIFTAKHDGSLPNFATEFVSTHPKTLKMYHHLFDIGLFDKLTSLMDTNFVQRNSESVGGHMHISRGSFTPIQVSKMLKFLYSNESFMSFICGRLLHADKQYYKSRTSIHPLQFAYNASAISPEKYTLARVTSNILEWHDKFDKPKQVEMGTIEVRAFKTPTTGIEVVQNAEFMFAMHSFVKDISGLGADKPHAFIDYVTNEKKTAYPLLAEKFTKNTSVFFLNKPSVPNMSTVKRTKPTTIGNCHICGNAVSNTDTYHRDNIGRIYCSDHTARCYACGVTGFYEDLLYAECTDHTYCSECFRAEITECTCCGDELPVDDSYAVNNRSYCETCAEDIDECAEEDC